MQPSIEIVSDADALSDALASHVAACAAEAVAARGRFLLAIPGGSVVPLLARGSSEIDASKWHLFWTDERCVPQSNPQSNFHLAQTLLFPHLNIPRRQIHPADGSLGPEAAALAYEEDLEDFHRFDLVLLGIGEDGHIASLFPDNPALLETQRWVAPVRNAPKPPPKRITLTFPVLNRARHLLVVATGETKADILSSVLAPDASLPERPVQMLRPADGDLRWLIDRAAAALLPPEDSP